MWVRQDHEAPKLGELLQRYTREDGRKRKKREKEKAFQVPTRGGALAADVSGQMSPHRSGCQILFLPTAPKSLYYGPQTLFAPIQEL